MKKISNNGLFVLFAICVFLTGCYSSRTFQYQFNETNKAIIRNVLANGKVGCENCYLNGACVQIVDSVITKDKYELEGKCALYSYHVTAVSLNAGSEIEIKIKCSLLVGRNKTAENYFLDETGAALFDANHSYIKSQLKIDSSKKE